MSVKKRLTLAVALGSLAALVVAASALAVHPRAGSGTPLRVPFVPAFKICNPPGNAVHTTPLAFPSCSPPVQESDLLTTGSNANTGSGFAKLQVFCAPPAPPTEVPPCQTTGGDQADIRLTSGADDVRCRIVAPGCAAAGADYTGQVIGQSVIRITDHANPNTCTNSQGNPPCTTATVQDTTFSVPSQCVDDGAPGGGDCNLSTTIDTLVPTVTKEFQRGTVSIFGIRVMDAGPDGSLTPANPPLGLPCPPICGSGDEKRFADQGLFIP